MFNRQVKGNISLFLKIEKLSKTKQYIKRELIISRKKPLPKLIFVAVFMLLMAAGVILRTL